ncbi:MAG TPA: tetratricopeptide repeat protein [Myxococcales bacterium]|nr:tetratricopeptide repeat protein [Myxococcales bacterium]
MTLALVALLALHAVPAARAEGRELARRSAREYDLGEYEAALRDGQRAYLLDPQPAILFNLGQAERKLHDWKGAEQMFRNFLRYRPGAANRRLVEKLIGEMVEKQRAAAAHSAVPAPVLIVPSPIAPSPGGAPAEAPREEVPSARAPMAAATAPAATVVRVHPRGHTLAWTLIGGAAALAVASVIGWVQVANFNSLVDRSQTPGAVAPRDALSAQGAALWGQGLGLAGAAGAAGLGVGAAFAW